MSLSKADTVGISAVEFICTFKSKVAIYMGVYTVTNMHTPDANIL